MFSGLPKLADKAFVIGFLVPVLVAILEVLLAFQELPWIAGATRTLASAGDLGKLSAFAAAVIVAALLLLLVNRPIYRMLEGYVGPFRSPVFMARALETWRGKDRAAQALRDTWSAATTPAEKQAANVALRAYLRDFRSKNPRKESLVLPTRFGNANRAFETYSADVYGVDLIVIWARLDAILPKAAQDGLGDARAQVNGFMNIAVLSAVVAGARLAGWVAEGSWRAIVGEATPYGAMTLASFLVGAVGLAGLIAVMRLAYLMAVERVIALGGLLMAAIDLNLPRLAPQLGYQLPPDAAGREQFWIALEESISFHNPVAGFAWAAAPPPPGPGEAVAGAVGEAAKPEGGDDEEEEEKEDGD